MLTFDWVLRNRCPTWISIAKVIKIYVQVPLLLTQISLISVAIKPWIGNFIHENHEMLFPIYALTSTAVYLSHGVITSHGKSWTTLQWRHNDHDCVSNHQPRGCLLNRLFRRRSKKTSKLRVTGLCVGNSPGPGNSPHKGPVTRKIFPFDDVIMIIEYHCTSWVPAKVCLFQIITARP